MSRKSQSQRKNLTQDTQAGPSQRQSKSQSQSQQQPIKNESELVGKCVRYFLYKAGSGVPIRKTDVQKFVLKNIGRNYTTIFNKAKEVLNQVYGFDVYECDDVPIPIRYIVSNLLPYKDSCEINNSTLQSSRDSDEEEDLEVPEDAHKVLTMLILTHIFMSNNAVTQNALDAFLELLQIDPDRNHKIFGNVRSFITNTMINQKYLITETDEITHHVTYSWGPRADREIVKHDLLNFVCKIYKDRAPKSWGNQFAEADSQFESEENGVEPMAVD